MRPADPLTEAIADVVRQVVRAELAAALEQLREELGVQQTPARYLKVADAAQSRQIGETTLRAAIKAGELPVIRRGRLLRIDPDALDAWLAASTVRAS